MTIGGGLFRGCVQTCIYLQRHPQDMDGSKAFPLKLDLNVVSHNEAFEVLRT